MTIRLTKRTLLPYLLTFPLFFFVAAVFFYPIIQVIESSFSQFSLFQLHNKKFIGIENYSYMLADKGFWNSLRVTLIYAVGIALGSYVIALGISLMLNNDFKGRTFARMIVFIPYAVPSTVAALIWTWMYTPDTGIVNFVLSKLRFIPPEGLNWLSDPNVTIWAVLIIEIWRRFPFGVLMLLAGLQSIPKSLYEIARVDGANSWQLFWHITMPSLYDISSLLLVLLVYWGFDAFDIIFLTTAGGPSRTTETLSIQAYQQMFSFGRVGYGSAIGVAMLIITLALAILRVFLSRKRDAV